MTVFILFVNITVHHPREEFFFVLYFFIIGLIVELLGTQLGVWSYGTPVVALQAMWMAFMYAQFALMARRISLYLATVVF
jgi:uncharacterized membrane protein YoaT (DUF817 family)